MKETYLTHYKSMANITFVLPEESTLLNITRNGQDVQTQFTMTGNQYTLYTSALPDVAGQYIMYHMTSGETTSCSSSLFVYEPFETILAKMVITSKGRVHSGDVETFPYTSDTSVTYEVLDRTGVGYPATQMQHAYDSTSKQLTMQVFSMTYSPARLAVYGRKSYEDDSIIYEFDLAIEKSTACLSKIVVCNGIPECDDLSDERKCSVDGEYSRMAIIPTKFVVPVPNSAHTICLYAFGELEMTAVLAGSVDEPEYVRVASSGYYCVKYDNNGITLYKLQGENATAVGDTITKVVTILYWTLEVESPPVKNIVVFNNGLSTSKMPLYVTECGVSGKQYPANLYLDHHSIVIFNLLMENIAVPALVHLYENAVVDYSYRVMESLCSEQAFPVSAVDLVTSYICKSGDVLQYHCIEAFCGGEEMAAVGECGYVYSGVLAMSSDCPSKAAIWSKYNNKLAVNALKSDSVLKDCTASECASKAYLLELQGSKTDTWIGGKNMTYTNWTVQPSDSRSQRSISINMDGGWTAEPEAEAGVSQICDFGWENSDIPKSLKFDTDSQLSKLSISKAKRMDKMSLCFASYGSGVLLHFIGTSSISNKDLYISIDQQETMRLVTVYILGFADYFDVPGVQGYICIRWSKLTGSIDLFANEEWIRGKNTYTKSRQIRIPNAGRMTIGAEMSPNLKSVESDTKFRGRVFNLMIWDSFLSPLTLLETTKSGPCANKAKTDGWLSFEEVIAGITDITSYSSVNGNEFEMYCLGSLEPERRRRSAAVQKRVAVEEPEHSVSINYGKYTTSPENEDDWLVQTGGSVKLKISPSGLYAIRKYEGQGNLKLEPQGSLCFTNIRNTDVLYTFMVTVYSTGMTALQVGSQTQIVDEGSPTIVTFDNVAAVKSNEICIVNILSPSDYAPLDSYIQSISYWSTGVELICPGDVSIDQDGRGNVIWPAVSKVQMVTSQCQYGKAGDYTKVGYAKRQCSEDGWELEADLSECGVKYTIPEEQAKEYFEDTTITDDTVEEFTDTISQVVSEPDEIDETQLNTAAAALEKVSDAGDVVINEDAMLSVVQIADTINQKTDDKVMQEQEKKEQTASKIIKSVANLAGRVELKDGQKFTSKTKTVSVAAYKPAAVDSSEPDKATSIYASFQTSDEGTDISVGSMMEEEPSTSQITIPFTLVKRGDNVWFTSYKAKSPLFQSSTTYELQGDILGAGIGSTPKDPLEHRVTLSFRLNVEGSNAYCQYWKMNNDSEAGWSSYGMTFVSKDATNITCETSHLTNFAILVNPSNSEFSGVETIILKVLTIVGCVMSIIGLIVTIIGLAAFKQIRSAITNKVHIGLAVSLLMAYVMLLVGADRTESKEVCYTFSALIHFCFLSAFCWMLCEAVNLYLRLVVVFSSTSRVFLKFTLFSTVVPAVIVILTMIIEFSTNHTAYIMMNKASGNRIYCWLQYEARMAAFMLPLLIMLCINFVVFILVMRVLFANKKKNDRKQWLPRLRSAVAVSTLVGLSWVVGVLALGEASFAINVIFTLLNSFQGCLICYLYCFAKSDVMTQWKNSFQSSFSRSSQDKSTGLSSTSAVHPSKTTSIAMSNNVSVLSKQTNASTRHQPVSKWNNNVYSNAATEPPAPILVDLTLAEEPTYEDHNPISELGSEPVYEDYSEEEEDEDDHIYESFDENKRLRPKSKRIRPPTPDQDEVAIALSAKLKGVVKEKVESYEVIALKNAARNSCVGDVPYTHCADNDISFQIKSNSAVSDDSNTAFNL